MNNNILFIVFFTRWINCASVEGMTFSPPNLDDLLRPSVDLPQNKEEQSNLPGIFNVPGILEEGNYAELKRDMGANRQTFSQYQSYLMQSMQRAVNGDPHAQVVIGNYYAQKVRTSCESVIESATTSVTKKDYMSFALEAIKWYTLADNQGDMEAPYRMYELMFLMTLPNRSGDIRKQAMAFLTKSADAGYFDAQCALGRAYMEVYQNYDNKKLDGSDSPASYLFVERISRDESLRKALEYLEKAMMHDHAKNYKSLEDDIRRLKVYQRVHQNNTL